MFTGHTYNTRRSVGEAGTWGCFAYCELLLDFQLRRLGRTDPLERMFSICQALQRVCTEASSMHDW